MSKIQDVSWPEIMNLLGGVLTRLPYRDDVSDIGVVGISRGGLPLTTAVASRLGTTAVGVSFIHTTHTDMAFSPKDRDGLPPLLAEGTLEARQTVVVVDDIVRSGYTMQSTVEQLRRMGYNVMTAVAPFAESGSRDFPLLSGRSVDERTWLRFPWDQWKDLPR